jgi:hypothetical protein
VSPLAACGIIRTARFAVDNETMHLTLLSVHQDRAAGAAGVVGRVRAGDQDWRGTYVVAGAGVRYNVQRNDRIFHSDSPKSRPGALPNSQSPTPGTGPLPVVPDPIAKSVVGHSQICVLPDIVRRNSQIPATVRRQATARPPKADTKPRGLTYLSRQMCGTGPTKLSSYP